MIPPQAYESCMGKKLGDSVQLSIAGGLTISGTCQSDGERLYLRPEGPPPDMKLDMEPPNNDQSPSPEDAEVDEEQYQEPGTENVQTDTLQQAPDQEEDDNSSGYQQQSPAQEDMNSDAQQQEQQSVPAGSADQAVAQQPQQPVQQPVQPHQEKPKGFMGKAKDFLQNLW